MATDAIGEEASHSTFLEGGKYLRVVGMEILPWKRVQLTTHGTGRVYNEPVTAIRHDSSRDWFSGCHVNLNQRIKGCDRNFDWVAFRSIHQRF